MHRSRIGVVLVDHPLAHYADAAAFWSAATGHPRADPAGPADDDPYEALGEIGGGLRLDLQRTGSGTPARVHLDIETDDVDAETARVVAIGATVVEERQGYRVMADPGGLLFCVVPVQTTTFALHATTWDA